MVSTFGSLNTVVTGLMAQQLSLNTVGHNLSNASTEGYSRQRVNLVASSSQQIYTGGGPAQLGMGVTSQSIIRIRDSFLDGQYWKENSILGTNKTIYTYLRKVEDVFGEPSETGLQTMLDKFWKSLETVSTDASNHSARAVAIQNGVQLCNTIQQEMSQFKNTISDINLLVTRKVDSINEMTSEILILNKQIVEIEAGKIDNANDLRDRRDYLVDQLSYMMNLQVSENEDRAYIIYGGGVNLVTATSRQELAVKSRQDADYGYEVVDIIDSWTQQKITFKNGELAALIQTRDSEDWGIKKYLNDLSNMAKFLLQEFNDVHKAGIDLDGNVGDNFFGKTGVEYNIDSRSDPPPPAVNPDYYTKGDWLAHLLVNDELTNPVTGTAKLAARTLLGEAIQDNPQGGHIILGVDSSILSSETLIDALVATWNPGDKIIVTLDQVAPEPSASTDPPKGTVLTLDSVTIDGTSVTVSDIKVSDNGSYIFTLANGLTLQIALSSNTKSGDTYTFTVPSNPDVPQKQGIAAGNNAVNLCNRLKVDISKTTSDSSLDTYYSTQMGVLGVTSQNAERLADNQQAVIDQLQTMRESVFGVNQDEELTEMVRFQKAYNSAARILTAMDEMLDKLINGTGRVGA